MVKIPIKISLIPLNETSPDALFHEINAPHYTPSFLITASDF
jgi:hypothetical protein